MSRPLPENPNLEYLRKEAKARLRATPGGKLAGAQHRLAREYGFDTWAALRAHVLARGRSPADAFAAAVQDSDAAEVRALLAGHASLRQHIDAPLAGAGFGEHAMLAAVQRSDRATIDVLLEFGAAIGKRTEWWAGGFSVLDECAPEMAEFLLARGAALDAHSAARLGRLEVLAQLVAEAPERVSARGGDGQTPLHFAADVEVARWLLAHGAPMDARDVDHESTPAQYMLRVEQWRRYPRDRQEVARYLVGRGCQTDLLMAAALGDSDLARRLLDADANRIRTRVSAEWFPMRDPRAGGTIYIWKLGRNRSAHAVARDFGHEDLFALLTDRTPEELKLELACELGDAAIFRRYLAQHPGAAGALGPRERRQLPDAAESNNTAAVVLMLEAGWPPDTPGAMGATALHWAAFNGNAEMTREILRFHPALEQKSVEYPGTPLCWAIFASGNGWRRDRGDYVGVVTALLAAGAAPPDNATALEPSDAVLEVLP